jgi:ribonuclease-3
MSQKSRTGKGWLNNERLEFLGDSVLDSIVADVLYKEFPKRREGFLTSTRSKIVQRESLNRVGEQMGLPKVVQWSHKSQSHNSYIFGNAVEALVGAVYLDRGYDRCFKFVKERILDAYFDLRSVAKTEINFKSHLIEWCQKYRIKVEYVTSDAEYDENNNPIFHTVVKLSDIEVGKGTGYSKKESHQHASQEALNHINGSQEFREMILATVGEDGNNDYQREEIDKESVVEAAEALAIAQLEKEAAEEQGEAQR